MERAKEDRLEKLREQGKNIYSISRLNSLSQCPYSAYITYVLGNRGDTNVWAALGSIMHDTLQYIIDEGISTPALTAGLLTNKLNDGIDNMEISGIDFPKDRNGGSAIRDNWIANMTGFCDHFKAPTGNFKTEQLVIYKVSDDDYVQGYIDLLKINEDGTVSVYDWKTSSQFVGDHLIEAGRQLVLYAQALEQEGYKVNQLAWVMLKYCVVSWKQKNGKIKEKICEWRNYVVQIRPYLLKPPVAIDIDEFELDELVGKAVENNTLDELPKELREQFEVKQYVRYYDYNQEVIDETLNYVTNQIQSFKDRGKEEKNYPPKNVASDSYFCSSLCGHSKKCPYYKDYCSTFVKTDKKNEGDDLF